MKPKLITLRIAFVWLTLAFASAEAAEIVLQERVASPGSIVRLGDVARVLTDDVSERQRLERLPLMPSPPPGTSQHLRIQSLRDLLQAQGESLSAHRFSGAAQVLIADRGPLTSETTRRVAEPVNEDEPTAAVSARPRREESTGFRTRPKQSVWTRPIAVRLRQSMTRSIATAVDSWLVNLGQQASRFERGEITVPDQTYNALAELRGDRYVVERVISEGPLQQGEVRLLISPAEGGSIRDTEVTVQLLEKRLAVVAKAPMQRGDLITASRVELQHVPQDSLVPGSFDDLEQVLGLEASRAIRPGDLLTKKNSMGQVLVQRGQTVEVYSGGGGVSVMIQAIARGEGRAGDLILVEAFDRSEKFQARVVGRGRLAVSASLGGGPLAGADFERGIQR